MLNKSTPLSLAHRRSRYAALVILLGCGCCASASSAVLEVVNGLRNGGCNTQQKLQALVTEGRLTQVAKHIADGEAPQRAQDAVGYQAAELSSIYLSGYSSAAQLQLLLKDKYCDLLMDAKWRQLGVEQRGNNIWMVLAIPHAIPADPSVVTQQILSLVNQARSRARQCGTKQFAAARPLRLNETLNRVALAHALDMSQQRRMSHTGSDGSTPAQRLTQAGYQWKRVGENVAAGAGSAQEVVSGWLSSPDHCANIMNPGFTDMGAGFALNQHDQYAVYWSQSFATPR